MSADEMRAVVRGAMRADGECVDCAATVVRSIAASLPSLPWTEVWYEVVNGEFGYETRGFGDD